jgi:hypothetical protein
MVIRSNVLIFPAGSEIGIEIFHALRYNLHIELFGASGKPDHARYLYDSKHYIEGDYYIEQENFCESFNRLLEFYKIDYIFPTHDSIALFLALHQDKISAIAITSDANTALVAREKKKTYEVFSEFDFCPKTFQYPSQDITFPVFIKPNKGQGGKQAFLIHSFIELQFALSNDIDYVICENLPGDELSVDCFTDSTGSLLFVGPRTRERVQMGISFHSQTVTLTDEIKYIAAVINKRLTIKGAWFFQVKRDIAGKYKLLEFAVRNASTMGLYRQLGINFPLLSLFDRMGKPVSLLLNNYSISLDRCLYNRYKLDFIYERVYIDFDDTVIVNGKVNVTAIRYLYDCRNRGIDIVLLTKHLYALDETLSQFAISKALFDKIIQIEMNENKADFIQPDRAIFIDNFFFDRQAVLNRWGIPVFDVDAIESLILD